MRKNQFVSFVISFFLISIATYSQTLYNGVGHIPANYQVNWNEAGLLHNMNSVEPKLYLEISPGNSDSQVLAAINTARDHVNSTDGIAIIYFPEGTYYFNSPVILTQNDSNIVFKGDDSDKTTLVFENLKNTNCFRLIGATGNSWIDLDQNIDKGESVIHTKTAGVLDGILAGDWREFKDEAKKDYFDATDTGYSLKVYKITPVRNNGIKAFRIIRSPNVKSTANHPYNIQLTYAINCRVKGVESDRAACNLIALWRSSHCEVSGCYIHEAMDYGDRGWGYDVTTGGRNGKNILT